MLRKSPRVGSGRTNPRQNAVRLNPLPTFWQKMQDYPQMVAQTNFNNNTDYTVRRWWSAEPFCCSLRLHRLFIAPVYCGGQLGSYFVDGI